MEITVDNCYKGATEYSVASPPPCFLPRRVTAAVPGAALPSLVFPRTLVFFIFFFFPFLFHDSHPLSSFAFFPFFSYSRLHFPLSLSIALPSSLLFHFHSSVFSVFVFPVIFLHCSSAFVSFSLFFSIHPPSPSQFPFPAPPSHSFFSVIVSLVFSFFLSFPLPLLHNNLLPPFFPFFIFFSLIFPFTTRTLTFFISFPSFSFTFSSFLHFFLWAGGSLN